MVLWWVESVKDNAEPRTGVFRSMGAGACTRRRELRSLVKPGAVNGLGVAVIVSVEYGMRTGYGIWLPTRLLVLLII